MSVPFSGVRWKGSLLMAINKQLKSIKFQQVKRVTIKFDPFHEKVDETRKFLFHLSTPKVIATNPSCLLKTNIVCDRSDPTATFDLSSGDKIIFNCTNLSALVLLQLCNKYISSKVPLTSEEIEARQIIIEEKEKAQRTRGRMKLKRIPKGRKESFIMASHSNNKNYNIKLIDTLYNQVPAFTDIFDEETWYIFVACFVATTFLVAFILSKFITLKPVD